MHQLRTSVRENRLSDSTRISEISYLPYVAAGTAWVAELGRKISGFAILDAPERSVWALFIDPDAEGRGMGRALNDCLVDWASANGLPCLSLVTEADSRAAGFYQQSGWAEVGTNAEGELLFRRILAP